MATSRAMTAITTNISMRVKPDFSDIDLCLIITEGIVKTIINSLSYIYIDSL